MASDGIYESTDPSGELFGADRVEAVIRMNLGEPAEAIVDALRAAVIEFSAGVPAADDRTAVIIRALA